MNVKSSIRSHGTLQNPIALLQIHFKLWISDVWPSEQDSVTAMKSRHGVVLQV